MYNVLKHVINPVSLQRYLTAHISRRKSSSNQNWFVDFFLSSDQEAQTISKLKSKMLCEKSLKILLIQFNIKRKKFFKWNCRLQSYPNPYLFIFSNINRKEKFDFFEKNFFLSDNKIFLLNAFLLWREISNDIRKYIYGWIIMEINTNYFFVKINHKKILNFFLNGIGENVNCIALWIHFESGLQI